MAVQRTLIGNIKGPKGDKGDTGDTGARGAGATVTIGSVTTTAYGGNANVTNSGTSTDAVLDFVIPQGAPGESVTDMENLTLSSMTEPSVRFPMPSIGDTGKVVFGKITKWFSDMAALVASKRAFMLQCDSLGIGIISSGVYGTGWRKVFKDTYSGIYDVYTTENVPGSIGAGITGFNSTNKHITNLRWTVENELAPAGVLNNITDVIVLSGTNDAAYGPGLYESVVEYINYARSVFKNKDLRIVIGCTAHRAFDTLEVARIYERACRNCGVEFAYDLLNLFASVKYNSDNTHYTQAGYDFTTPYVCEYIITGKTDYCIDSDIETNHGTPALTYTAKGVICRASQPVLTIFKVTNQYLSSVHFEAADPHVYHTIPIKEGTPLWRVALPGSSAYMYKLPNEEYFRAIGDLSNATNPIINGDMGIIRSNEFIPIAQQLLS